jgi:hypothetical protein
VRGNTILVMAYKRRGLGIGSLHDAELLAAALLGYEQRLAEISGKIAEIQRLLGRRAPHDEHAILSVAEGAPARGRRNMSAAARRRIAAAQKKRWAAYRKRQAPATAKKAAAKKSAGTPMRRMSAAGRKRIVEAQRKRWAAVRAKKPAPKAKTAGA